MTRALFTSTFDTSDLITALDELKAGTDDVIRPAAQAGSQVFYDEARRRAPISEKAHFFYGSSYRKTGQKYGPFSPGNLQRSIYQVFDKADSKDGERAVYRISWRTTVGSRPYAPYGNMAEFGTSHSPAFSFIRGAFDAKERHALDAAEAVWDDRMGKKIARAGL